MSACAAVPNAVVRIRSRIVGSNCMSASRKNSHCASVLNSVRAASSRALSTRAPRTKSKRTFVSPRSRARCCICMRQTVVSMVMDPCVVTQTMPLGMAMEASGEAIGLSEGLGGEEREREDAALAAQRPVRPVGGEGCRDDAALAHGERRHGVRKVVEEREGAEAAAHELRANILGASVAQHDGFRVVEAETDEVAECGH